MTDQILRVEDLCLSLNGKSILEHVSFSLSSGEMLGIVGESGAGKSMTMYCLTSLLPQKGTEISGRILFGPKKTDLLTMAYRERGKFCASHVSIILQDSINALDPFERIEDQWEETLRLHTPALSKDKIQKHIADTMLEFGLPDPLETMRKYPHQLSGGMRQRIAIAMSLESNAEILIADEPTTSLDSINQRRTIDFLKTLCSRRGLSLIYITHNLGIVSYLCNRVTVLRRGQVIESGSVNDVFHNPCHEYTRQLIEETSKLQEAMKWKN